MSKTSIVDHEAWVDDSDNWNGRDLFIRPDVETDISYERRSALAHIGKWLGDPRTNLLVVLGDLGTGKTRSPGSSPTSWPAASATTRCDIPRPC